jgi:hypothetical protein
LHGFFYGLAEEIFVCDPPQRSANERIETVRQECRHSQQRYELGSALDIAILL